MQEDFRSFYVYWIEDGESHRERVFGRSPAGAFWRMKQEHPNSTEMHVKPYYEESKHQNLWKAGNQ